MKAPLTVVIQSRAAREIEAIDGWWRTNRAKAPDLFLSELDAMLSAVALMPTLGSPAKAERLAGVRRLLLPRAHSHGFCRVRDDVLEVLAVWHAVRGAGPAL